MLAVGSKKECRDARKADRSAVVHVGVPGAWGVQERRRGVRPPAAELEQRCEAARSEKLAPLREAAFQQCMNAKRGADTEADCRRKTAGENGNRVGGTPRFYDLPACVEAFEHKRQRR